MGGEVLVPACAPLFSGFVEHHNNESPIAQADVAPNCGCKGRNNT